MPTLIESQPEKDRWAWERAKEIVREHLDWHRHGRPRPIGGFPPEYFADELMETIAKALLAVRFHICHCELSSEAYVIEVHGRGCELCDGGVPGTPENVEKFFRAYEERWRQERDK